MTRRLIRRAVRATRKYGFRGAARKALKAVKGIPSARAAAKRDLEFDARYGVDTHGIIRLDELEIASLHKEYGVRYQATQPELFRDMVRVLPVDYREFVFVDFGAGKGRALLLASEFPFSRIIGVEFSAELSSIAHKNVARFRSSDQRCREIDVVCMDAAEFELPRESAVLYFYNPFTSPVMEAVLRRTQASLAAHPRETYILYAGDAPHGSLIEQSGFTRIWTPVGEPWDAGIFWASGLGKQ